MSKNTHILLNNNGVGNSAWYQALSALLPAMKVEIYPHISDQNAVRYAVVWNHIHGDLCRYPNLQAIFSIGAGVDHILQDATAPDVDIVRLADDVMADDMAMHALYWVIHFQRHYGLYLQQQQRKHWQRYDAQISADFNVGVLGVGNMGAKIAQKIAINGYATRGWSRRLKTLTAVQTFDGQAGLAPFLNKLNVLINCLPANEHTREIINRDTFEKMAQGAFIINIGRGETLNDADLISALDSGQIAGAALDVFTQEPVPNSSPYWGRSDVYITPHMAGPTHVLSAAAIIAQNIMRAERGEKPFPLYDKQRGY